MKHTVAVIDAGGRGAALIKQYAESSHVAKLIAIPGNDYMQELSQKPIKTYTHLKTTSVAEILTICKKENVSLVDVAQDNAVAVGLVDTLVQNGIQVFGPTKKSGEIEWNKAFAREFMARNNVPQPAFHIFQSIEEGISYIYDQQDQPWFIKAAGLCEGKGALPAKNNAEAAERIVELQKFGKAANVYLVEEWLQSEGELAEEFSTFAISDGNIFKIVGSAQDHKRVFDGDKGENTGGMGCSTPPLVITDDIRSQIENIFSNVFRGLREEGRKYKGVLYLGGIIVKKQGKQKVYVIEFNARWGDPEAEVILPGITTDFFTLGQAVAKGDISRLTISSDKKARVVVAGCAKGYPQNYQDVKGKEILGLEKAKKSPGVTIYGAGIREEGRKYFANGGRLFYVVGEGKTVLQAREKAYRAIKIVTVEGDNLHYRTDIGWRDIKRL